MNLQNRIARRYIFSKANKNSVNYITLFSVLALAITSAAMLIILNIFSGLEDINIRFFSNINPEIKITSAQGKVLKNQNKINQILQHNPNVKTHAKLIEEKVYITYYDKEHIAYLTAFDENYKNIVAIDTAFLVGKYDDIFDLECIIPSEGVARKLQMYIDEQRPAKLLMPKPGYGLINNQDDDFNTEYAYSLGVYFLNEQQDQNILASLKTAQSLLDLDSLQSYSVVVKSKNNTNLKALKTSLQQQLGNDYVVKTRQEQDAAFLKLMQLENLIIYLILALGTFIASFNLAGAIAIIILTKKEQIKTLWSLGLSNNKIKQVFFSVGLQITALALIIGLALGSIICFLQLRFGLVMASQYQAFPVQFALGNYTIVILTVISIGALVSYLVSRRANFN